VEGLGQIATPESRADLKQLFDKTTDSELRGLIVEKLAAIASSDELTFFSKLLRKSSGDFDSKVQVFAILGIGRVGGEAAVKILGSTPASATQEVRQAAATALGNTRSSAAVPLLIAMYSDEAVRNELCWALATLTHYQWCDGGGTVLETQNRWRSWWRRNGSRIRLYGMEECPALESLQRLSSAF
jgi:HEAT repeat protein